MSQFIALLAVIVTIACFGLAHLIAAVYWAGRMSRSVTTMSNSIERLTTIIDKHDNRFYEKQEAKEQIARRDTEVNNLWDRMRELEKALNECKMNNGGRH